MKKIILSAAFILTAITFSFGQFQYGAGGSLTFRGATKIGVQGKMGYNFADKIDLMGAFTYYLGDFSYYALDADVQYQVMTFGGDDATLSVLGGINTAEFNNIGINIGAFINYPLSSMNFYIEPKIVINNGSGFVLAGGLLF